MIELKIIGLPDLIAELDDISRNQLPYGTATALTRTAQDAQTAIVNRTLSEFTVRTGWYKPNTPFGIKIIAATKASQQAEVYNLAPFMQLQETGGMRVVHSGRKYLAIPSTNVRRTKRELIARSSYPSVLMNNGRGFVAKMRSGKLGIWIRSGKGRGTMRLMYTLQPEAQIKAQWQFIETGTDVVDRVWKQNWYVEMGKAIQNLR